jgi:hypothetical protein
VYPSITCVKLKRQITVAGHVVVKEYKDEGDTRTLLDRPALNQLRADLKTDLFDPSIFLRPIASPAPSPTTASIAASAHGGFWPVRHMLTAMANVRVRAQSGKHMRTEFFLV